MADGEGKVFFEAVRTILIYFVTVTLLLILSLYIIDKLFTMYIIVGFIRLDILSSQCIWEAQKSFPFYIYIYFSFSWHWERRECKANCLNFSFCSKARNAHLVKNQAKGLILDTWYRRDWPLWLTSTVQRPYRESQRYIFDLLKFQC